MEAEIKELRRQLKEQVYTIDVLRQENNTLRRIVSSIEHARQKPACFCCGMFDGHGPACPHRDLAQLRARHGKVWGLEKKV